ncbi:hypothetical protein Desor_1747 [Desulfosporosinus orientis DSM 765]|uniref:Uracil DNA glycosylase superfamily protein n=1 Tax=Desulfosporosinus orientis (strain ATCC 19365 / DSM 765 / NCIMB 8382 / VKM B-1628 / Singapore I) TaxID=768706 RepID=G7W610_DESOD|nr:hypothetical protein [Desulfosporosinus orientis]AET67386.1 hypothetical protein Desor_1747 [Desulfosporosinus orientis DSM 765]
MKRESGEKNYPIWVVMNPKHPISHENWTPILDEIQDRVYREMNTRIETANIYFRNAVSESRLVPNTLNWWGPEVAKEIELFKKIAFENKPKMIFSLGAFAFEFLRRVFEIKPEKGPKAWSNSNLGDEFERAIENFDINKANIIPLLHRVGANSSFIEGHNYFGRKSGENYYTYVGAKLAEIIIQHKDYLSIWIDNSGSLNNSGISP